ncbi:ABC transporter permease [soil metagenome]
MLVYLIKRLVYGIATVWLVVSATFVLFYVIPGAKAGASDGEINPVASILAGRNRDPQLMRRIERDLGLDRPLPVQYASYVERIFRGDFGRSYLFGAPVGGLLRASIGPTLSIVAGASVVWLVAGIAVGVTSARRRGTWLDRTAMGFSLSAMSVPVFVTGLLGVALLVTYLNILVQNRYVPLMESPVQWFLALWLPWIVLALPLIAVYARMVRSNLLDVRGEDYIRTSIAKGLSDARVARHELRGALTPIVTMFGLDFAILVGGSVIVEQVFRIPGLGSLLLRAVTLNDFPVAAGVVITVSVVVIIVNLVVDLLYGALDPRTRFAAAGGAR